MNILLEKDFVKAQFQKYWLLLAAVYPNIQPETGLAVDGIFEGIKYVLEVAEIGCSCILQ